jgi:hypothetical protein
MTSPDALHPGWRRLVVPAPFTPGPPSLIDVHEIPARPINERSAQPPTPPARLRGSMGTRSRYAPSRTEPIHAFPQEHRRAMDEVGLQGDG